MLRRAIWLPCSGISSRKGWGATWSHREGSHGRETPDYGLRSGPYRGHVSSSTQLRRFLAERYCPGSTPEQVADAGKRVHAAAEVMGATGLIRIVSTAFVPADEVVLTIFEAAGEAEIREVSRRSGVVFDRVQPVVMSATGE